MRYLLFYHLIRNAQLICAVLQGCDSGTISTFLDGLCHKRGGKTMKLVVLLAAIVALTVVMLVALQPEMKGMGVELEWVGLKIQTK